MNTITLEQGTAILQEIVKEHGDFVYLQNYDSCEYILSPQDAKSYDGEEIPNRCVVGEFLYKAGVTDEQLGGLAQNCAITDTTILAQLEDLQLTIEDELLNVLRIAQERQDQSHDSWRQCVELALDPTDVIDEDFEDSEPF
jgi:hypothetical protein